MLELGTTVYGGYKIASMPYPNKVLAYTDISEYWKGSDCTTYYDKENDEWYIIAK